MRCAFSSLSLLFFFIFSLIPSFPLSFHIACIYITVSLSFCKRKSRFFRTFFFFFYLFSSRLSFPSEFLSLIVKSVSPLVVRPQCMCVCVRVCARVCTCVADNTRKNNAQHNAPQLIVLVYIYRSLCRLDRNEVVEAGGWSARSSDWQRSVVLLCAFT